MYDQRLNALLQILQSLDNALIAYSGGVDSTLLVKAAQMAGIRVLAVTSRSETTPSADLKRAQEITAALNISHQIILTNELNNPDFVKNPSNRCFFCKDILFSRLTAMAQKKGFTYILDGSNAEDVHDHRPGLKANEKHGVISPLKDVGLNKKDIRELSRDIGLSTWDLPSSPCLSSRFPYGQEITRGGLAMVSAAEDFLRSLGFSVVRVRTAGIKASIEVGAGELERLHDKALRRTINDRLRRLGYEEITYDTEGYVSGKLNRSLQD